MTAGGGTSEAARSAGRFLDKAFNMMDDELYRSFLTCPFLRDTIERARVLTLRFKVEIRVVVVDEGATSEAKCPGVGRMYMMALLGEGRGLQSSSANEYMYAGEARLEVPRGTE